MKVYKIVLASATMSALLLVCLLQVGCGSSIQANPGKGEGHQRRLSKEERDREQCIFHLRVLDVAKQQWALRHKKNNGDGVAKNEVDWHIRTGAPKCPAGGTYTYGKIGEPPRCSVPGHVLR